MRKELGVIRGTVNNPRVIQFAVTLEFFLAAKRAMVNTFGQHDLQLPANFCSGPEIDCLDLRKQSDKASFFSWPSPPSPKKSSHRRPGCSRPRH